MLEVILVLLTWLQNGLRIELSRIMATCSLDKAILVVVLDVKLTVR